MGGRAERDLRPSPRAKAWEEDDQSRGVVLRNRQRVAYAQTRRHQQPQARRLAILLQRFRRERSVRPEWQRLPTALEGDVPRFVPRRRCRFEGLLSLQARAGHLSALAEWDSPASVRRAIGRGP